MPPITNTYLRKYGSLIDQISRVQIRKIHPYTLLTNLEIDIPTIQRLLNKEHVIEIANEIVKYQDLLYDNRILLGYHAEKLWLIDGMHRLFALKYLKENNPEFILQNPIWIHIKECKSMEEISETYRMVNRNYPLDEFQTNLLSNSNTDEHVIYVDVLKYFNQKYKSYLSKENVEPRIPGINIEKTIKKMSNIRIQTGETLLQFLKITNSIELLDKIEQINLKVKESFMQLYSKLVIKHRSNETDKKYIKYRDQISTKSKHGHELYLGLPIDWFKLFYDINYPLIYPDYQIVNKSDSVKDVWNNHSVELDYAMCFCCEKNQIQKDNCHMGHILAKRYGGLFTVDNLRPICISCNCRMGTIDLFEFKNNVIINSDNSTEISIEE